LLCKHLKNTLLIFISIVFLFSNISVYGVQDTYHLEVDEHLYDLAYSLDGDMLAMAIDPELTSLLIGIENVKESQFWIQLPNELISAESNEFAILVNGLEINYEMEINQNDIVLGFYLLEGTQEIEIIGTKVIPEFPFGSILILIMMIATVTTLTKFRIRLFR